MACGPTNLSLASRTAFRSFVDFDATSRIGVFGPINVQSELGVDDIGVYLLGADRPVDMHVPRPHVQVLINPALLKQYAGRYRNAEDDIAT